ncbi:hypothetical protein GA0070607_2517 [Micromonospora coriariae]|uniref:Uncharacterized protein n=1 Tax=Micromonospora coriariae TaxID=285665 RepID=A0A1C4VQV3_9ACTN|nr:hypothetical protein GA0070607_2517 [Micromonospora coriariae]
MTAVGVAAGAGAAQLGFGYGLGVITWTPTDAGATDTAWADGLAWATWLAASSTVLGAVCAQRLHFRAVPPAAEPTVSGPDPMPPATPAPENGSESAERSEPVTPGAAPAVGSTVPASAVEGAPAQAAEVLSSERGSLLRRVSLALGAAIGGLVTVLLVAVPARIAVGADTGAPQRVAAVHAGLGILVGVLVALWALRSRAAAVNVTATAAWLWLLAVVSVIDGVRVGRGLTGAQLGTWQLDPDHPRYWIGDQLYWPGALLALVPALLIGALAARRAARSTGHRVGAAASGAAGPLLVAVAYLTTLPHWSALGPAQLSTQLIAPYAVIAGLGGSVLVAVLAERANRSPGAAAQGPAAGPAPAARTDAVPAVDPEPTSTGADAEPLKSPSTETAGRRGTAVTPRIPAPRTDPDLSEPADGGTAEAEQPNARRARATKRTTRPTAG